MTDTDRSWIGNKESAPTTKAPIAKDDIVPAKLTGSSITAEYHPWSNQPLCIS